MRTPDYTNTFEKGMNRDYNPNSQLEGTTRCVINGVYLSDDGDIYYLTNEKGTNVYVTLPAGYKVIGEYTLDKDIVLFLINPTNGFSQIGFIDSFIGNYNKVVPVVGESADLNFSIDHPIDVQGRKIFTGERIVYFTDNYNPHAFLNLDSPPSSNLYSITRINPIIDLPVIDYVETLENGGALHGGVYQFVAQYLTRDLNPLGYGLPCNPIPVVPNPRSVGKDKYEGAYPDVPITISKSLKLSINNIDDKFPFLQVVAIHYDTIANTFTAAALSPIVNISPGMTTKEFIYDGNEINTTPVLLEDINSIPVIYDRAKCIEQKDDTLLYSNLTQVQERYNFQEVANNIVTKYAIKEVPYVDNLSGNEALFFITKPPFIITDGMWDIYIQFSQPVDLTSGSLIANYNVALDPAVPGTLTAPTGVEVDPANPTLVIVHMDTTVPAQTVYEGMLISIINVQNSDLSQTIPTQTVSITADSPTSTSSNLFFADYKDEELTFDGKGMMREEVYSLGFGVLWKDGAQSPVYPIPGNDKLTTITTNADTVSKICGTYTSSIDYPTGQGYPEAPVYSNSKIRHHKMPTLIDETHFRVDTAGNVFIRILGITYENIIIPVDIRSQIQSIFFVRQPRNIAQNRSIVAQGLVNNMVRTANEYNYNNGGEDVSSRVYKKNPFFNNFYFKNDNADPPFASGKSIAWNMTSPIGDVGATFSPDIVLGNADVGEVAKMKNVLLLKGGLFTGASFGITNFTRSENQNKYNLLAVQGTSQLRRPLAFWLSANYTDIDTSFTTPTEKTVLFSDVLQTGDKRKSSSIFSDYDVDNSNSGKFYLFKTDGSFPINNPYTIGVGFKVDTHFPAVSGNITVDNRDYIDSIGNGLVSNYLYNFYKDNTTQYGPVDGTEYVFMSQTLNSNITNYTTFNGDTFITKFSYGNKDDWKYRGLYSQIFSGVPRTDYRVSDLPRPDGTPYKGIGLRALGYYFVESTVNTEYRHQFIKTDASQGVKYFPKFNEYDTLAEDPVLGDSDSYNNQYSFDNNIRSFVTKPAVFFNTSGFETRTIYSQKAVQGELNDSYRIFPANNFYDIPKHTGEIWDSFVENNILYLHTPKSLWRTFMNEVVQQATETAQIILGTSGLFTIPAKEVMSDKGGYAGTISQWGGVHTPQGYMFPDGLQGKIFIVADQNLSEVSADGMTRYLNDNLSVVESGDSYYIDNPFNPLSKGIHGGYDYELKRCLFTKYHSDNDKAFTLSYSFLNNAFAAFHTYLPNKYINFNNRLYSIKNDEDVVSVHRHNVGDYGKFYSEVNPWTIQFVINKESRYEKTFDNLGISMAVEDEVNNTFVHMRSPGDFMFAYTPNKHTGVMSLKYDNSLYATKTSDQQLVRFKNQKYQTEIPMNSVINDTQPIFENGFFQARLLGLPSVGNINQNALFRGRMKGNSLVVTLLFNNDSNYKTTVRLVDSNFRVNAL